jgi:D-alanyl-lipoteichoic acid acyltransferase DltB (MBOAT superfamily)
MAFIPIYILILVFTIVVDYFAGIWIEESTGRKKKLFLIASLVANIGVLSIFKYYRFLIDNVSFLLKPLGLTLPLPYLSILLPIGLSFHTFQAMGYTIEVYRSRQKAERHPGIYALYIMFYPQLAAGPIERPFNLLHQFYEKHPFDYQRVTDGMKLMVWGLFKKAVISDRLAIIADQVFGSPQDFQGISLIVGTIFFSFQIFCDFSGYSDMAIGAAQVMGFKLMKNFDRPYFSASIGEFWRAWHISLSTWFRDYLYIPLGGNRVPIPRWYFNLSIVFLISGLWHGANWTFVIWGALHGFYLIFGIVTKDVRQRVVAYLRMDRFPKLYTTMQIAVTFSLITFAWIFFRAKNVENAVYIVTHLTSGIFEDLSRFARGDFYGTLKIDIGGRTEWAIAFGSILFMEIVHLFQGKYSIRAFIRARPIYIRWGVYYAMFFILFFFGIFENRQFIYFQF